MGNTKEVIADGPECGKIARIMDTIDEARLDELGDLERKRLGVLRQLLDEQRDKRDHQFALVANMGMTRSYITSVSLRWVAEHVSFAEDLPMWEKRKDESGRLIVDEETMEELRQHEPDWGRQFPLTRYLAIREFHKFPPILVAAWKDWVNDVNSPVWLDGISMEDSVTADRLDSKAVYMDLDCGSTSFFALDGQHRLMAIRGLRDLLSDGKLDKKGTKGAVIANRELTIREAIDERARHNSVSLEEAEAAMLRLMEENIGMEIIPAVLYDESRQRALRRLRSIFVHVNRKAKPLTSGPLAQIDADDGFVIVARRTMAKHELLKPGNRVRTGRGQVRDTSFEYTTLADLVEIAELYLGGGEPYRNWHVPGDQPFRPSDDELDAGVARLVEYFDLLSRLPSHRGLAQDHSKSSADFRKPRTGDEAPGDNILFWPLAQKALADAFRHLLDVRNVSADKVMGLLTHAEKAGMLQLRDKKSVWFGVLCDVVDMKIRRQKSYQRLCSKLMMHMLGGGTPDEGERMDLLDEIRKARKTADDNACIGFDGEPTPASDLELPEPW